MNASLSRFVAVAAFVALAGCAQNRQVARVERENVVLKEKVAALEAQVAELKAARTPLTINGLTLTTPEVGEMRWTAKPVKSAETSNWYVSVSGGRLVSGTNASVTFTGATQEIEGTLRAGGIGTIQMGRLAKVGAAATTTSTTTTTTTTQSSTSPAVEKPAGNR